MNESVPAAGGDDAHRVADILRDGAGGATVATGQAAWRFACGKVVPAAVVRPRTVGEVQASVRVAAAHGLALVPCGGATVLGVGLPPRRYDGALCVRGLDRIVAHEMSDLTVTAEAGVTIAALNERLRQAGQWLPLDPSRPEETTVGGLVAADRNGPLRLGYGKVRDLLLGVTVVGADGDVLRAGGRVVKNVAGYDLPKLFTGSYGTLGVIVEATFKLRPCPMSERLFVWPAASAAEATRRALALLEGGIAPVLLEALNEAAAEMAGVASTAALVVGCAGDGEDVEEEERRLSRTAAGIRRVDDAESGALRKALGAFPVPLSEDALVARVSVRPASLPALLGRFEDEARSRRLTVEIAGHAGSGVAWCQLAGPLPLLEFELCAEWMRLHAREQGGWVVFESLPAGLCGRVDPWGFSGPAVRLMAGVKGALDPAGIFSPGRFVGGL